MLNYKTQTGSGAFIPMSSSLLGNSHPNTSVSANFPSIAVPKGTVPLFLLVREYSSYADYNYLYSVSAQQLIGICLNLLTK